MAQSAELSSELVARMKRRAVQAAAVGTTIEWYDFFLYTTVAALVLPKAFFPGHDPLVSTLASFTTNLVGFAARPVGAAIFGHYGDRIGRKRTLIATLLIMGVGTFLIGLLPAYDRWGATAAAILVVLRILQGIGIGGEWGGSVLLSMEWNPGQRRGWFTSWPQFGAPAGLFLAIGSFFIMNAIAGNQFNSWGWRVPFLASVVLVAVGLWMRLGIMETPVFDQIVATDRVEQAPVLEVLAKSWREVILTALCRQGQNTQFYIFSSFALLYGTTGALHFARGTILGYVLLMAGLSMIAVPLWGRLSDTVGRKRVYLFGCAIMIPFIFVYYGLLDTKVAGLVALAIAISLPLHDAQYGPQAGLIAETFTPRLRYSGASLGYQLVSITAGGPAPLIAAWLLGIYHSSLPIAIYVALCAAVAFVATLGLKDNRGRDVTSEYDEPVPPGEITRPAPA